MYSTDTMSLVLKYKVAHKVAEKVENKAADKVLYRDENTAMMEPVRLAEDSRFRPELMELAFDLVGKAAGFRRSLPPAVSSALADLVRSMNCYYSNLIEGHNTHPIDIERALKGDFSGNTAKRNLQLEAKAHIEVQRWLDDGGLRGNATTRNGICEIHRRFCSALPEDLLWVEDPKTHKRLPVVPGEFRHDMVAVGRHIPVSPEAVPRFMERFENAYTGPNKVESVLSTAAAHHRLAWIHPFIDGNGRVARLMSHATLSEAVDSGALWSVARGLSRNVNTYKALLANCDLPRRNDLDRRGALSEEALVEFTRFFLKTCIDQVEFMESLVKPDGLRARIHRWVEEESLNPRAGQLLDAVLYRGEVPRGEVASMLGISPRLGRDIVASLVERGVLTSDTAYGTLRVLFPAKLATRWMPDLFPAEVKESL
jgi:Fic family protein